MAKQVKGVSDSGTKRVSWAPLPMLESEGTGEATVRVHAQLHRMLKPHCVAAVYLLLLLNSAL